MAKTKLSKRRKFPKAQILNEESIGVLKVPFDELRRRGAIDFNIFEILDRLLASKLSEKTISEFVAEKTPDDYKIEIFKKNPELKKKLLRMAKDHDFGLQNGLNSGSIEEKA